MLRDQDSTEQAILNFIQKSAVLEKTFNKKCKSVFDARKKAGKDAYFCPLGYSSLFAPRSKPVDEAVEIKSTQEMKEAFKLLFKMSSRGTQNDSYRRKASFIDVSSGKMKTLTHNSKQCLAVDNLFSFNEARMAFRKFCRTPFMNGSETSLSFMATFDGVVTDTVDLFKFILRELKDDEI